MAHENDKEYQSWAKQHEARQRNLQASIKTLERKKSKHQKEIDLGPSGCLGVFLMLIVVPLFTIVEIVRLFA